MRIAVNTRFVIQGKLEGIGWFSYETSYRMARAHPEHEFIFLFDRPFDPAFTDLPNVQGRVVRPPARHPWLWKFWFDYSIPFALRRCQADLFVSLDGFCSLRTKVPTLMVAHDLAFEHFDTHVPRRALKYYRSHSPKFARHATRLATVSEATKTDLVTRYQVSPDQVDVVYNGSHAQFRALEADEIQSARDHYAEGSPYFVYVGSVHPRKNIANLFRAFDLYTGKSGSGLKLVIAGRMAWQTDAILQAYKQMDHGDQVIFTGHLEPEALAQVLGGSEALIYPSLFEGFGIPVLEGFQAEVPVITSDRSSLPEVAGKAALLVDPEDPQAIVDAMQRIVQEEGLRARLVEAGRARREQFSWDRTAALLWISIERTAEAAGLRFRD